MIKVEELSFTYPDGTRALYDITTSIEPGSFQALLGQNGSGKSTFAKCLSGILDPSEGTITVNGTDRGSIPQTELARKIGYVFQNPDHQLFTSTVRDDIASGPRNLGLDRDTVEERLHEAAEIAGVDEELFDQHPFFLTKGLRQRVAIASVLAMRPDTIIVDEPTTGQDHRQSIEVMEFLSSLNQKHDHTILIITHDIYIVAHYAEELILFNEGKKHYEGSVRDAFGQPELLQEANVTPPQITKYMRKANGQTCLTVEEALDY
ncbi:MAG: energy-coupling factor ABC transporter ATP-binding protein [bacterium]